MSPDDGPAPPGEGSDGKGSSGKGGLADLQARIDRARAAGAARDEAGRASGAPPSGLGVALRLSTELLAGVVVGGGLGWFLDRALGTSPFGLVILVLVGFAAGTTNLIRAAGRPATAPRPSGPPPSDRSGT